MKWPDDVNWKYYAKVNALFYDLNRPYHKRNFTTNEIIYFCMFYRNLAIKTGRKRNERKRGTDKQ